LVFKVPIPVYHQIDQKGFERVEGSFAYEQKQYEVVKRKLENGILYVYCINDTKREKLLAELAEHTQLHIVDHKGTTQKKSAKPVQNFLKEYTQSSYLLCFQPSCQRTQIAAACYSCSFNALSLVISTPPPCFISTLA
jgi:hypothetical protein